MFILLTQLNWLAVIVAGIAALLIGIVWYLPPTFGTRWAGFVKRYTGLSDSDLMPSNILLTLGFWLLGFIANALALAILIRGMGISNLVEGILLAVIVWAGFGLVLSSWPVIHAKTTLGALAGEWCGLLGNADRDGEHSNALDVTRKSAESRKPPA